MKKLRFTKIFAYVVLISMSYLFSEYPIQAHKSNQESLKIKLQKSKSILRTAISASNLPLGPLPTNAVKCGGFNGSENDCIRTANEIWALYNAQITTETEEPDFTEHSYMIAPDGSYCPGFCLYSFDNIFGSEINQLIPSSLAPQVNLDTLLIKPISNNVVVTVATVTYTVIDLARNGMERQVRLTVTDIIVKNTALRFKWEIANETINYTTPLGAPFLPGAGQYFGWSGL